MRTESGYAGFLLLLGLELVPAGTTGVASFNQSSSRLLGYTLPSSVVELHFIQFKPSHSSSLPSSVGSQEGADSPGFMHKFLFFYIHKFIYLSMFMQFIHVHCTLYSIQRVVRSLPVPLLIYIYVYFFIIGSLIHAMPLHWNIHFRIHVCICVCIRVCVIPLQCVKFSDNNKFSSRSGPMGNLWPFTARLHLN